MSKTTVTPGSSSILERWMLLGPFVIRTGAQFEREYMYERDRILDVDYLAADGGEAAVEPVIGRTHDNVGLGPKKLAWKPVNDTYLYGTDLAGEIIYETVQRNCVFYAAAQIVSAHACYALLDAYHSGAKVWVNGELVCNEPYGQAKGIRTLMPTKLIRLRKGDNLILFKFRPGYICDKIDFCIDNVTVSPLASLEDSGLAFGRIRGTSLYTGSVEKPNYLVETTFANPSPKPVKALVRLCRGSKTLDSQEIECAAGSLMPVRLRMPVKPGSRAGALELGVAVQVEGAFAALSNAVTVPAPPKYDGLTYMMTSFHFDTTYHEEQRVYAMGAFDIVRSYLEMHRKDPNFRSIISEVDYLKPYFDVYPEDRDTLLQVFREKRSEPDVMYNQPNEQNCGGEALVRNFLYGQLFHGRVLGNICHAYGPGDVFGHPNQLSQIARKSGCMGVTWDKHIYNFPPFFNHLSLDGSTLPHKRGAANEDQVHAMGLSVKTGEIDQTPPTDWHADLLPEYRQGTYYDLLTEINRQCEEKGAHLPIVSRDMSLYHAATAMSRMDLKIGNRLCENRLVDAEKFATIASLLGAEYPEKALDKAWRQVLCGQHHDSITGTHNEISHVDLVTSYREALELATDVLDDALRHITQAIGDFAPKLRKGLRCERVVVFNPLAWARTDVAKHTVSLDMYRKGFEVRNAEGAVVPHEVVRTRSHEGKDYAADIAFVAADVPSLGYRQYFVVEAARPVTLSASASGNTIENEFYKITVDPARGGGICSLYDKTARKEVINAAAHVGNKIAVMEEVMDRLETQHEFYTTGLKMFSGEFAAHRVETLCGPLSQTLRVYGALGDLCETVQEITLHAGIKRVDFRTTLVDCQRENYLYAVTFPTTLKGAAPVFDERFGVVTRNTSRNYLDFRTHQMIMFSDCGVYAANKWMEQGVNAVVSAGRNRYPLSMVGLITPEHKPTVVIAEELQRVLVKKGVTCTPWFDKEGPTWGSYIPDMHADRLYTCFRLSLGIKGRNAYSKEMLKKAGEAARAAFEKQLAKKGYAFALVKDDTHPDTTWPAIPALVVEATDLEKLAEACDAMLADFPATATLKIPAEADATGERSVVDDYGVAVINTGTYANSVERGGVICMMLQHTCLWYGGTNNFPEGYLVPEHKNHAFTYSLYPHAGDWRVGRTQHVAHEVNHPLITVSPEAASARAHLGAEASFLTVEPSNVILSALKPWGNPVASFQRNEKSDAKKGVMIRLYDTEGVDSETVIRFGSGAVSAWTGNLLEEREADLPVCDGDVRLYVPPFSIETVGLQPDKAVAQDMGRAKIGAQNEAVQPVWVRSWEHDAESMPMGYMPVVCTLSRKVEESDEGRTLVVTVNAVNDYTDSGVKVNATLILPDGWKADAAKFEFAIDALGRVTRKVAVRRPANDASGQIKLRYKWDGDLFQDVLEIGGSFDLQMEVENRGDVIVVRVTNPTAETIEGELAMVTPVETWSEALTGDMTLLEITPRTQEVRVAPGKTITCEFHVEKAVTAVCDLPFSYWAVAKLMVNGRIQLKRCDRHPSTRIWIASRWNNMLFEKYGDRLKWRKYE